MEVNYGHAEQSKILRHLLSQSNKRDLRQSLRESNKHKETYFIRLRAFYSDTLWPIGNYGRTFND